MLLGSERLLDSSRLNGLKVGILANPASIDHDFTHVVDRLGQASLIQARRDLRPAARLPLRRAGQHDRDAARARTRGARAGLLALQRDARADRGDAAASTCSSIDLQDVGARIYTYIYTMANCLRAAARHGVPVIVCDRPNPIGGVEVEGPMLEPGLRVVRRPVPHPDAPRHDDRRARAAVQRAFRHRRRARGRADGGLDARHVFRRDRPAVGDAVAEHADARHRDRLSGHGAVRRHDAVGRARHDAAVRADRRAVDRRRTLCRRDEPALGCRACTSGRRASSRRSRSTPSAPAAAARFT